MKLSTRDVVIAATIAAQVNKRCCCLTKAKMAGPVRGHPITRSQQGGEEKPERDPQQEGQLDAAESKDIADYDPDVDYVGSEPKVEPVTQVEREVHPDEEYSKMEITHDGTLQQKMMPRELYMGILWVHRVQRPKIMASKLQDMYTQLGFSPKVAKLLIRKPELDSHDRLQVLTDKNVNDICNIMRKTGGKNASGMPNIGQQVLVIAQENLKLAVFLFHHKWRCTLGWEITKVDEGTVCLLAGQKKLKHEYKDPDMLPKINTSDMAGMMESIKEYFR